MSKVLIFDQNTAAAFGVQLGGREEGQIATLSLSSGGEDLSASGAIILTGFEATHSDKGQIQTTLDGRLFYASFGENPIPYSITGLAFHNGCGGSNTGIDTVLRFYNDHRPSKVSSNGQIPLVTIQVGRQRRSKGILRSCRISGDNQPGSFGFFRFQLACLMVESRSSNSSLNG